MKNKYTHTVIMFLLIFLISSCSACNNVLTSYYKDKKTVSIVSYNTQTFFDAIEDGNEFKEFKGTKSKWSKQKYINRLSRLKYAVTVAGLHLEVKNNELPDILVLQEIESKTVLEDFCKQLPLHNSYEYAVFIPGGNNAAFSSAILSKFPIESTKVYRIHSPDTALRPLIESRIKIFKTGVHKELVLFSVHWKSKTGNNNGYEIRKLQEEQLYKRLKDLEKKEPGVHFIVCGDFNQTLPEFTYLKEFKNCWEFNNEQNSTTRKNGSYFYKGKWEDIDHFFYSNNLEDGEGIELVNFNIADSYPLTNDTGIPAAYSVFSGEGFSDHLPIGIVLKNFLK